MADVTGNVSIHLECASTMIRYIRLSRGTTKSICVYRPMVELAIAKDVKALLEVIAELVSTLHSAEKFP